MCGLTCFFARESVPDYKHLDTLFMGSERRGQDGFGFVIIRKESDGRRIRTIWKDVRKYSDCKDDVKNVFMTDPLKIGDVVMAICRAAPETEGQTDVLRIDQTMQPIVDKGHGLAVVHNGAVSRKIHNELKEWAKTSGEYEFTSDIDSEAILASYVKHGRNMKDCMQELSGGFAFLLFDEKKDCLYVINDHMQIAHGYSRVVGGFFLHSDNDVIGKIIQETHGVTKDGVNIWENYYHHFLDGHAIRQIDLQSGCMSKQSYTPRYMTPTFDTIHGIIK